MLFGKDFIMSSPITASIKTGERDPTPNLSLPKPATRLCLLSLRPTNINPKASLAGHRGNKVHAIPCTHCPEAQQRFAHKRQVSASVFFAKDLQSCPPATPLSEWLLCPSRSHSVPLLHSLNGIKTPSRISFIHVFTVHHLLNTRTWGRSQSHQAHDQWIKFPFKTDVRPCSYVAFSFFQKHFQKGDTGIPKAIYT